jgi:hypothetical protein
MRKSNRARTTWNGLCCWYSCKIKCQDGGFCMHTLCVLVLANEQHLAPMTSPLHLDFAIQYYTARPVCSAKRIRHQLIFMRTRPSPSFLHQHQCLWMTHALKFLSLHNTYFDIKMFQIFLYDYTSKINYFVQPKVTIWVPMPIF